MELFNFITKQQAAQIIKKHPATLSRYRKQGLLLEGIHFVRSGNEYLYNQALLTDWVANGCETNTPDHQRAIALYLSQKLGNQTKNRRQTIPAV